jgi:hypothetical protein
MQVINHLVEGELDEAVAVRIIQAAKHYPGVCYGKKGVGYIKEKVRGFNKAVHQAPFLTLVDFMDTGQSCPPEVVSGWLPHRHQKMLFRVVVREIESWIIADRRNLARFLKIHLVRVPVNPEQLTDPKLALVNLARHSRSALVRDAVVPESGSTAQVGRLYLSEMRRFVIEVWDAQEARENAPSLNKCLISLEELD